MVNINIKTSFVINGSLVNIQNANFVTSDKYLLHRISLGPTINCIRQKRH